MISAGEFDKGLTFAATMVLAACVVVAFLIAVVAYTAGRASAPVPVYINDTVAEQEFEDLKRQLRKERGCDCVVCECGTFPCKCVKGK